MNTVTFGEYNSYSDLNLILSSKTIGSPSVKTSTIDLPGSDGVLDFTEYFGEPKYSNRALKFQFTAIRPVMAFDSTIKNLLHGQKMKIVLSDNSDVYFYGRVSVGDWLINKGIATIEVACDCDPYRMKKDETIVQIAYDTPCNDNICPHFGLWNTGTGYQAKNEDTMIFTSSIKATSPQISVSGSTWITLQFDSCGRYYVNQYNALGTSVGSSAAAAQTYIFKTAATTAYIQISLYPVSTASFPISYSNMMMSVGEAKKQYIRYSAPKELVCINSRKVVIPEITADKAVTLSYNGTSISLSANTTYSVPEFELHKGENMINILSAATGTVIKAIYREGDL